MAKNLPTQGIRSATVSAVNVDSRTVELAFSSEAEVARGSYYEVLSHAHGACDLSRLNDGGPLLWGHDWQDQIGVVERAWIDSDGVGRAVVRLSESHRGSEMLADVHGGIKRNVSIGYNIHKAYLSGDRNGMDVVTVTSWQPYEISIVSVPADTAVGIGRAKREAKRGATSGAVNVPFTTLIAELLQRADEAKPIRVRDTSGLPVTLRHLASDEQVQYIPQPAAASMLLDSGQLDIGQLFGEDGKLIRVPNAESAGKTIRLPTALTMVSRVAMAGTAVVQWSEGDKAVQIPGGAGRNGVAWMRRPKALRVCRPAVFKTLDHFVDPDGNVNDQDEVETQPHPALVVPFDFPKECHTLAADFIVKRSDRRNTEPNILAAEIATGIALGLADEVDRLVLAKVASTTPTAFTLPEVATAGLQLGDLQAITNGEAAAIGLDGVLRAAGVPAHLTGQAMGTFVGDFGRTALVVGDRIDLHAKKMGRNGDLTVTVLVDVLPVVADPSAFWVVSA